MTIPTASPTIHKTIPVLVWADVDEGIAAFVRHLNTLMGIRTLASCQGTIHEGGHEPYSPQVMVTWESDDALALLSAYRMTKLGDNFGYVHPTTQCCGCGDQTHTTEHVCPMIGGTSLCNCCPACEAECRVVVKPENVSEEV